MPKLPKIKANPASPGIADPGLLARKPILAVYHEQSSVVDIIKKSSLTAVRVVPYDDNSRAEARVEQIAHELTEMIRAPSFDATSRNLERMKEFSARSLAGRLADCLNQVVAATNR